MKKILYVLVALFWGSCAEQDMFDDIVDTSKSEVPANNEYASLIEQARWGNGDAYLKLAEFHRSGTGVRQDFLGTISMLAMADQYGGIKSIEDYMVQLPAEDNLKLFFTAMENFERKNIEEAKAVTEKLVTSGYPEGYTLQGIMAVERGDTIEGKRLIGLAKEQGSTFAELLTAALSDWRGGKHPSIESLNLLTDRIPLACKLLGDVYAGVDGNSTKNEELAAMYYRKADEGACLGKRAAGWLLNYYMANDVQVGERELERLRALCGAIESENQEVAQQQHNDPALEDVIGGTLSNEMENFSADKAIAYVVETKTGWIKAHVSLQKTGNEFSPYIDTFSEENLTMHGAATYLALLSTGKISPDYMVDTGCGIYNDVKDHNWRRGGYGEINMEFALTHRSLVGYTKAIEYAFGGNKEEYERTINSYLNKQPNKLIGMLTFYNAVANGGKMVELVTEGNDVTVINEQIAAKEHIDALQKGLRLGVKDGLFKKAASEYTDVAACGRTFMIDQKTWRLELCGYFPAENPEYTIMVVMEKGGLPASAGGMCGPVMHEIVNTLLQ
jgi:cell division protein FtsI (penicillin-binding protein 3)